MVSLRREQRVNASNNRSTSGEEGKQSLPTIEESHLSAGSRLFSAPECDPSSIPAQTNRSCVKETRLKDNNTGDRKCTEDFEGPKDSSRNDR